VPNPTPRVLASFQGLSKDARVGVELVSQLMHRVTGRNIPIHR